jgi:hypothetical protein
VSRQPFAKNKGKQAEQDEGSETALGLHPTRVRLWSVADCRQSATPDRWG